MLTWINAAYIAHGPRNRSVGGLQLLKSSAKVCGWQFTGCLDLGACCFAGLLDGLQLFSQPPRNPPLLGRRRKNDWNISNCVLRDILHRAARACRIALDKCSTWGAPQ